MAQKNFTTNGIGLLLGDLMCLRMASEVFSMCDTALYGNAYCFRKCKNSREHTHTLTDSSNDTIAQCMKSFFHSSDTVVFVSSSVAKVNGDGAAPCQCRNIC